MKNFLLTAALAAGPIAALPNDNLNVRAACARDNCFRGVRQNRQNSRTGLKTTC